jgi:tRNA (guanine-N7-)-methyltransferase
MDLKPFRSSSSAEASAYERSFATMVASRQETLRKTNLTLLAGLRTFVLEIGCGHGHMLSAYAATHPDEICIGIDIIADRIDRADRKKNRARLSNLHFVHASAADYLETIPPHTFVSKLFVLFPDPWPKRRHHKNRLIQPDFLTHLRRKVSDTSHLYFRTDDHPYFSAAEEAIRTHPEWETSTDPWIFEFTTVFQERASLHYSLVAVPKKPNSA